ncbi:MAG: DUF4783 domain-containing protein [Bacteroidales bacterium]|nr:DUF4783 domain-containing protein [Bacteroidales bacterium]
MKPLLIISILLLSVITINSPAAAQTPDEINENIANAIKTGNSKMLAEFFNSTIDISLPKNEDIYSKAQAELVIKDFFKKNPPKSFKINHQGSSDAGSKYIIGTYISSEKIFRTYILLEKVNTKYLIQQLQFEVD